MKRNFSNWWGLGIIPIGLVWTPKGEAAKANFPLDSSRRIY